MTMKRGLWLIALLFGLQAAAQNLTMSGNLTVQASACGRVPAAGYAYYVLPSNASSVAITLSGTWSGTVQFVGSVNGSTWIGVNASPLPSGAAVTSTSSTGTWTVAPQGLTQLCVYASTYSSGKVAVSMASTVGASLRTSAAFRPRAAQQRARSPRRHSLDRR